jgi:cation transport ATPase
MLDPRARNAARSATVAGLLLLPTAAHASGGWEGITTLIGVLALPALFVVIVALSITLALKKWHRGAGIAGIVLGALAALWQLFWFSLEFDSSAGFALVGALCNLVVFVLAGRHLRAAKQRASQQPNGHDGA